MRAAFAWPNVMTPSASALCVQPAGLRNTCAPASRQMATHDLSGIPEGTLRLGRHRGLREPTLITQPVHLTRGPCASETREVLDEEISEPSGRLCGFAAAHRRLQEDRGQYEQLQIRD